MKVAFHSCCVRMRMRRQLLCNPRVGRLEEFEPIWFREAGAMWEDRTGLSGPRDIPPIRRSNNGLSVRFVTPSQSLCRESLKVDVVPPSKRQLSFHSLYPRGAFSLS